MGGYFLLRVLRMISYDRSSGSRTAMVAVAVLAVAGAGAWWWMSGDAAVPAADTAASAAVVASAPTLQLGVTDAPAADGEMSAVDQAAISQAMSKQPDGQKQLQRVTTFLKFQRDFERWQGMQDAADPAPRHALAKHLMDILPDRVSQAEVTLPEATLICAMLLNDLEPDEAARNTKNEACKQRLESVSPRTDTEQGMRTAQCQTEYRRREAALVSEFQARPASQRDPQQLEAELDKAKRAVYDSPTCGQ